MGLVTTEMFAEFLYSPEMTYDELHEREERLIAFVEATLESHAANFIHFEFMGDSLHAQCVFPTHGEDLCHSLCDILAEAMDRFVAGRLLFVRKNLSLVSFYSLWQGKWQEAQLLLPYSTPFACPLK